MILSACLALHASACTVLFPFDAGDDDGPLVCGDWSEPAAVAGVDDEWAFDPTLSDDERILVYSHYTMGDLRLATRPDRESAFVDDSDQLRWVNSDEPEGAAALSPDGRVLLFTRDAGAPPSADIWIARRDSVELPFGAPERIAGLATSTREEEQPGVWWEGGSTFFVLVPDDAGGGSGEIWEASCDLPASTCHEERLVEGLIGAPVQVSPSLPSDGRELYYAAWAVGVLVAYRFDTSDAFHTSPEPLFPDNFQTPFVSMDGRSLYMSRNADPGFDMVVATRDCR